MRRHSLVLAGVVCLLVSSCKSSEGPGNHIVITPSGTITFFSLQRTRKLTAQVVDANGAPVAGAPTSFTWSTGSAAVATVDTGGIVTAKGNGSTTITASSSPLQQQATVTVSQAAASLMVYGGNAQIAMRGQQLATPLSVLITDSGGSGISGMTVAFAVASGGGSVVPASAQTGAAGTASTIWTLGSATTNQSVTATAGSFPAVTFTGTGLPPSAAGFQISVVNVGPPMSAGAQAAFDSAVAKWQSVITGDIPDFNNFTAPAVGPCPAVTQSVNVDDLLILARVDSIDGPGKILGQATPCWIRSSGLLTIMGIMTFDSADVSGLVAGGSFNSVVLHEMGHVLGFGTLWDIDTTQINCLRLPSSAGSLQDTYYSCTRGRTVFDSIGGTTYTGGNKVPIENCVGITGCGAGTFNSHWRESTFFNELMTGYLNSGVANPLSVLTAAEMQDLGYTVNLAASDAYTRTFTSPPAAFMTAGTAGQIIDLSNDVLRTPIGVMDSRGRVLRYLRRR